MPFPVAAGLAGTTDHAEGRLAHHDTAFVTDIAAAEAEVPDSRVGVSEAITEAKAEVPLFSAIAKVVAFP